MNIEHTLVDITNSVVIIDFMISQSRLSTYFAEYVLRIPAFSSDLILIRVSHK